MTRMCAKFIGLELGMDTQEVYAALCELGLVEKNKDGNWIVTVSGCEATGAMSRGNCPVPTFDFETIRALITSSSVAGRSCR